MAAAKSRRIMQATSGGTTATATETPTTVTVVRSGIDFMQAFRSAELQHIVLEAHISFPLDVGELVQKLDIAVSPAVKSIRVCYYSTLQNTVTCCTLRDVEQVVLCRTRETDARSTCCCVYAAFLSGLGDC